MTEDSEEITRVHKHVMNFRKRNILQIACVWKEEVQEVIDEADDFLKKNESSLTEEQITKLQLYREKLVEKLKKAL